MKIAKRRIDGIRQGYHIKPKHKSVSIGILRFKLSDIPPNGSRDLDHKSGPSHEEYLKFLKRYEQLNTRFPALLDFTFFIMWLADFYYNKELEKVNDKRIIISMPKYLIDILYKEKLFFWNKNMLHDNTDALYNADVYKNERENKPYKESEESEYFVNKLFKISLSKDIYKKSFNKKPINVEILQDA